MEYSGFKIEHDGVFGYFSIKALGRGSVPKKLKGRYTTTVFAQKDIDAHLIEKGGKNVKAESS